MNCGKDSAAVSQAVGHAQLTARSTPLAHWVSQCPLAVNYGLNSQWFY